MTHPLDSIQTDSARILSVKDTVRADSSAHHAALEAARFEADDSVSAAYEPVLEAWFRPDTTSHEPAVEADSLGLLARLGQADEPLLGADPIYVKESFFAGDSLLNTGRGRDRQGVAGDPVPYTIRGDNMFTSLLLLCFIVVLTSVSNTRQFVRRQLKDFLYPPHMVRDISETSGEIRFQVFLVTLACLLLSIGTYIYATTYIAETYVLDDYQLVAVFFGCFLVYYVLKALLYELVNNVFFSPSAVVAWREAILFITAMMGVLLFVIVLVQVYFDLSFEKAAYYYYFVLILVKSLTFYKCWSIFFRQFGVFLQTFLYFCTLEIVPPLLLGGAIWGLIDLLKITF